MFNLFKWALLGVLLSSSVYADALLPPRLSLDVSEGRDVFTHDYGSERAALTKISHELDTLVHMIPAARASTDPGTRIRFQYDWLLLDIYRIRSGIEEHLLGPPTQPRRFPPLKGEYRR